MYHGFTVNEITAQLADVPGPVFSIGCRSGKLEKCFSDAKINITSVGPELPIEEKKRIAPQYKSAADIPKEHIGRCTLFLGWASVNKATYDIDAIRLMKPHNIVIVHEPFGAGGSSAFHKWLYDQTDYAVKYAKDATPKMGICGSVINELLVLTYKPGSKKIPMPDMTDQVDDMMNSPLGQVFTIMHTLEMLKAMQKNCAISSQNKDK